MEYKKQWIIEKEEDKQWVRELLGIKQVPKEGREIIQSRQVSLQSFSLRKENGLLILSTI